HHVEMLAGAAALATGGALDLQRADADEIAARRNQPGAAPVRMRGEGEDRVVDQIFPVAGEFLSRRDARGERLRASAGGAYDDAVAEIDFARRAEFENRQTGPA